MKLALNTSLYTQHRHPASEGFIDLTLPHKSVLATNHFDQAANIVKLKEQNLPLFKNKFKKT